jgi:hypothetical protein
MARRVGLGTKALRPVCSGHLCVNRLSASLSSGLGVVRLVDLAFAFVAVAYSRPSLQGCQGVHEAEDTARLHRSRCAYEASAKALTGYTAVGNRTRSNRVDVCL